MAINPNVTKVYQSLEEAPSPSEDGEIIAVEIGHGWLRDYTAKSGEWIAGYEYYPAVMD